MSAEQLPPGWRQMPFEEIAESVTERVDDPSAAGVDRYVGLEHLDPESTRIRRWGSPDDVGSTKLRFYPGDVVYGRRRAYQRKLGVADFEGICSAHALVLRARPATCLPEFLPYFLQSDGFHERAVGISVGSLSPTINWKTLAKEQFALPPLDEQKRIVEVLSGFASLADRYEQTRLEATMLAEASVSAAIDDPDVGWVPLGDVAKVVSGQSWSSRDESVEPAEGAVPVLGISCLRPDGEIDGSTVTYVHGLVGKTNLFRLDPNCLVIIRTNGNEKRIGNTYLVNEELAGRAMSAFVFGARFESRSEAELACRYMQCSRFQKWSSSLVAGSTGLKNLPIRRLRTALVPRLNGASSQRLLETLRHAESVRWSAADALTRLNSVASASREHLLAGAE